MLKFNELENQGIKHAFIEKPYDLGPENPNRIDVITKLLEVDPKKIYFSKQAHTNKVEIVLNEDKITDPKFINNDGLITNIPGVTLLTYVADCQGIFLYDPRKKVIGNIHSGWKGTANKIVINAVHKMIEVFQCDKNDIQCFINPAIKQCHFEIGEDVLEYFVNLLSYEYIKPFVKTSNENEAKYYLDLVKLNKRILIDYGIKKENIFIMDYCTVCENERFHSYRSEKTVKRNGCIISLSI